ncbi:MAG: efflux RND transporter periplasmic adaptor subunit [Pirellulales bacterium]
MIRTIRLATKSRSAAVALGACAAIGGAAIAWALIAQYSATSAQPLVDKQPTIANSAEPARVKVMRPIVEDLVRVTTQPAHVEAYETTEVYAKVAGYVETMSVDIGDEVRQGQVLATLHIPEMQQELQRKEALLAQARSAVGQTEAAIVAARASIRAAEAAQAEAQSGLQSAEAELQFRTSEYRRFERLASDGSIPRANADEKLNQLKSAEAAVAKAQAAIDSARAKMEVEKARLTEAQANLVYAQSSVDVAAADLEHTKVLVDYGTIKAPFAGTVTRRRFDTGAFIQSASNGKPEPLFTVARTDRLRIIVDLPESECALVQLAQPAVFRMGRAEGREYRGKVARFAGALDQSTRTMRAEVELDDQASGIHPGAYGSVTITLANSKQALLLPLNAVVFDKDKASLKTVVQGRVAQKQVQLGQNDGVRVQVLSGLAADDVVITDGKAQAAPGQAVEVIQ